MFEARSPKEPAIITEIDGTVSIGDITKGLRKVTVESDTGESRDYMVPRSVHINVQDGERVHAGDPLIDGSINPHDVLQVLGETELQRYLVDKVQEVYRSQSVSINDKHIEVIVRQMMRSVKIEEVGDTEFLIDEQVDRWRFREENERVSEAGGQPAVGRPLLLGHHQGIAVDGEFHLGSELPGDDPCADRGGDHRQGRPSARSEGERHRGSSDPCRNGNGLLPRFSYGRARSGGARSRATRRCSSSLASRTFEPCRKRSSRPLASSGSGRRLSGRVDTARCGYVPTSGGLQEKRFWTDLHLD